MEEKNDTFNLVCAACRVPTFIAYNPQDNSRRRKILASFSIFNKKIEKLRKLTRITQPGRNESQDSNTKAHSFPTILHGHI